MPKTIPSHECQEEEIQTIQFFKTAKALNGYFTKDDTQMVH